MLINIKFELVLSTIFMLFFVYKFYKSKKKFYALSIIFWLLSIIKLILFSSSLRINWFILGLQFLLLIIAFSKCDDIDFFNRKED